MKRARAKRVVTERNRRAAIYALEVCANDRAFMNLPTCTWNVLGQFPRPLADIFADTAFRAIPSIREDNHGIRFLEAAALLRDGWDPGDPVVYLKPLKSRTTR